MKILRLRWKAKADSGNRCGCLCIHASSLSVLHVSSSRSSYQLCASVSTLIQSSRLHKVSRSAWECASTYKNFGVKLFVWRSFAMHFERMTVTWYSRTVKWATCRRRCRFVEQRSAVAAVSARCYAPLIVIIIAILIEILLLFSCY